MNLKDSTIGILGLGQVGGSIAATFKANHPDIAVVAYDRNQELMDEAAKQSLVKQLAGNAAELIERSDVVTIALPVNGILEVMQALAEPLKSKTLVTDTGSVMSEIVALGSTLGMTNFISGHPLAGTEKRGAEAWLGTLFVNSNYFMTSTESTTDTAKEAMVALIEALGARPAEVRSIAHDISFATTSNVAHVLAFCMRRSFNRLSDQSIDQAMFACPSYRSATRVAASDPEMVFQMLWHNREYLAGALRSLSSELEIIRTTLKDEKPNDFRRALGLE